MVKNNTTAVKTVRNQGLGESYTEILHKSGVRAYIIPKDFSTTYVAAGVLCGGLDNSFYENEKLVRLPYGMAHFVEHKLFANPDGEDTFEKMAESGAYCNAYTSFDKTVYLFSISGDISSPLKILLEGFTTPYFTDENVENEASIISEEIKMYSDDPYDAIFYAMMDVMYSNRNTAQSVCGSVESVNSITPEMLYKFYEAFYCPEKTVISIAGQADVDEVIKILDEVYRDIPNSDKAIRHNRPAESPEVTKDLVFLESNVPIPIFNLGIKITPPSHGGAEERIRHDLALNMLCEHYFSECDEFITSFFEKGEMCHLIKFSYDSAGDMSLITLSGESQKAYEIANKIKEHVTLDIPRTPITDEELEILRRVVLSHHLVTFDATGDISNEFLAYALEGFDLFRVTEIIDSIDTDYLNNIIKESFKKEKICIAVSAQNKEVLTI